MGQEMDEKKNSMEESCHCGEDFQEESCGCSGGTEECTCGHGFGSHQHTSFTSVHSREQEKKKHLKGDELLR